MKNDSVGRGEEENFTFLIALVSRQSEMKLWTNLLLQIATAIESNKNEVLIIKVIIAVFDPSMILIFFRWLKIEKIKKALKINTF